MLEDVGGEEFDDDVDPGDSGEEEDDDAEEEEGEEVSDDDAESELEDSGFFVLIFLDFRRECRVARPSSCTSLSSTALEMASSSPAGKTSVVALSAVSILMSKMFPQCDEHTSAVESKSFVI